MKIDIKYVDKIISLPGEAVIASLSNLGENELKVLLYLCSDPEFRKNTEYDRAKAIKTLDMQWASIEKALSSLVSLGVIGIPDNADLPESEIKDKKTKASVKADRPSYSKDETSDIICRSDELKKLINEDVPRIIGKAVSYEESMIIVSMYDYLRMTPETIIKIVSFCAENDMYSFRFVERTAYNLYDADITDASGIDAYLEHERKLNRMTAEIKKLFGVGHRALISKEKHLIKQWCDTYGYGMDMIELAYEATVRSINEASFDYAGGVLKRWHEQGIRTPEDVQNDAAKNRSEPDVPEQKRKKTVKSKAESFDADEFMAAALKRSYADGKKE